MTIRHFSVFKILSYGLNIVHSRVKYCLVFLLVMSKVYLGRLIPTIKRSRQEVRVIMLMKMLICLEWGEGAAPTQSVGHWWVGGFRLTSSGLVGNTATCANFLRLRNAVTFVFI